MHKEIKIKEKWLQKELDDWANRKWELKLLLETIGKQYRTVEKDAIGLWKEIAKKYKLPEDGRFTYDHETKKLTLWERYSNVIAKSFGADKDEE